MTAREYLPNAIVQLDRFHLRRMVRRAFGGKLEKGLWELLQKGDDKAFLNTLESLVSNATSEKNKQDRAKVVALVRLYREHLVSVKETVCPRIKKAGKEDPADWLKGRVTALASPIEGLWMRMLHDLVSPQWLAA